MKNSKQYFGHPLSTWLTCLYIWIGQAICIYVANLSLWWIITVPLVALFFIILNLFIEAFYHENN